MQKQKYLHHFVPPLEQALLHVPEKKVYDVEADVPAVVDVQHSPKIAQRLPRLLELREKKQTHKMLVIGPAKKRRSEETIN